MKKYLKIVLNSPLAVIGGILGALGGSENSSKMYRRIGIPVLLMLSAYFKLHNLWVVMLMSMAGALSMGYGIPCATDSGSQIGRFWYNLFKQNHLLADIFTRGTVGLMTITASVILPIIKQNWIIYILASLAILGSYCFLSWRNLGTVPYKNKKLLVVDLLHYTVITAAVLTMIWF
jgi:hypothetical protein